MPVTIRSPNTTFLPPTSYSYTSSSRVNRSSSPTSTAGNRYNTSSNSYSRTSHRYSTSNGYDSATVPTRVSYTNYGEHSSSTSSSNKPPTGSTRSRLSSSVDYRNGSGARESSVSNYSSNGSSSTALGNGRSSRYSSSSGYHSTSSSSASTSSKRHPLTSLSVATVAADLYDKYSPSNYKSNVELSRSRSLSEATTNRLLDNAYTYSTSPSRGASRDRDTSALTAGASAAAAAADRASLLLDPTAAITSKVRNASLRSTLPPKSVSPSRYNWERTDTGRYGNHRTLSDSAATSPAPDVSSGTTTVAQPSSSSSSNHGSRSSLYGEKTPSDEIDGLCGLRNIGNTCFMNSVIQCLSHTRELTDYLKQSNDTRSTTKDQRIFYEFAKLIREMWTPRTRTVTPSELKSAFSSKHRMYSGCAQQDAQEFLRFFLDSLHNASNTGVKGEPLAIDETLPDNRQADQMWQWYTKVENSVVQDLFVGQFKSSLKCTVCGNSSVTFDPFWDLSVPLQSSSRCKLESCLDFFIKEEVLDGDEMPTCSKCKTRRKSTKSFTIQRFPKYLVIHLKRFSETRWSKLTNIVEFPTGEHGLDMAPYAATPSSSAKYTLYGISNHMGSTAGGHYVALCKHPLTKKWHEFNDNIVTDASESQLVSSSAYLLFYERA